MQNLTKTVFFSILVGFAANAMSLNAMDSKKDESHKKDQNLSGQKRKAEDAADVVVTKKSLTNRPHSASDAAFTTRDISDNFTAFLPPINEMTINEMLNYHEMFKQMQFQSGNSTIDAAKFGCFNNREFVVRLTELVRNDTSDDFRYVMHAINPKFWCGIQDHQIHVNGLDLFQEMKELKIALVDRYRNACIAAETISDEDAQALRYLQVTYSYSYTRNESTHPSPIYKVINMLRNLYRINFFRAQTQEQKLLLNSLLKSMWNGSYTYKAEGYPHEQAKFFLDRVNFLIHCGADVNTKAVGIPDSFGHPNQPYGSPLLHETSNPELIKLLLKNGANPNLTDNLGKTSLHEAIDRSLISSSDSSIYIKYLEKINLLLEANALVNAQDNDGNTPLHIAVHRATTSSSEHAPEIIELLLQHGANPLIKDTNGLTPLKKLQDMCQGRRYASDFLNEQEREVERLLTVAEEKIQTNTTEENNNNSWCIIS